MLGNAAGTAARAYEHYYQEAEIDGVELDPAVSDVGRRLFGMGELENLTVHDEDARGRSGAGCRYIWFQLRLPVPNRSRSF